MGAPLLVASADEQDARLLKHVNRLSPVGRAGRRNVLGKASSSSRSPWRTDDFGYGHNMWHERLVLGHILDDEYVVVSLLGLRVCRSVHCQS